MSHAHVGIVIETLLANEDLRIRFALERLETIADLACEESSSQATRSTSFCQTDAFVVLGRRSETRMAAMDRHAPCGLP